MGVNRTISAEYRNKAVNGDDYSLNPSEFATNLVGNAMASVQCKVQITVAWDSSSSAVDFWDLEANRIVRSSGNFLEDGFFAGQDFGFLKGGTQEFTALIDSIDQTGRILSFTLLTGSITPANDLSTAEIRALGNASVNQFNAIFYRFGLPTNLEPFTIDSRISSTEQRYQLSNVTGSLQAMIPQGTIKDFVTGSAKARVVSTDTYAQTYEIVHEFVIAPWALEGQADALKNLQPPIYFAGNDCLRHCFEIQLSKQFSQTQGAITARVDDIEGFTGWFNENFNGGSNSYEIDSILYEDASSLESVTALQNTRRTRVTCIVLGSFTAGQRVGLLHSVIPNREDYSEKTTSAIDNFLYNSLYVAEGSIISGGGAIKSLSANIVGAGLEIVAEIEYTAEQALYIENFDYLLAIDVCDTSLGVQASNSVSLIAHVKAFLTSETDVEGLMSISEFGVLFSDKQENDRTTDFIGFDTDALLLSFDVDLDTNKAAKIEALQFSLIADNDILEKSFLLDRFDFDLSASVQQGSVQILNINQSRGYPYRDGNRFNDAKITTGLISDGIQSYKIEIGQKARWEDWIRNLNADSVFYNNSKPNANLNLKSSNYSQLQGYNIRGEIKATVKGNDSLGIERTTEYRFKTPKLKIKDYGEQFDFSGVVETFDLASGASLDGRVLSNADTLVRATFTPLATAINLSKAWAAIRLHQIGNTGQQIYELSSSYATNENAPLQPIEGEDLLTLDEIAGFVVCKAVIKGQQLEGKQLLVARYDQTPGFIFEFVTENQEIEFFFGGTGLAITMFVPDGSSLTVPANEWFSYDFGSAGVRRLGFTANNPSLIEEIKISRQDQSGNGLLGNIDFTQLENITVVEAQNNKIETLELGSFVKNAGLLAEFHNNEIDSSAVVSQLLLDNEGVNEAGRIFTLFGNEKISESDISNIQSVEALGLNVIIPLWGLQNK